MVQKRPMAKALELESRTPEEEQVCAEGQQASLCEVEERKKQEGQRPEMDGTAPREETEVL
jgi:hypothetical protein